MLAENRSTPRSDEELQKHRSLLSNMIQVGLIYLNGKLTGFVQYSARKRCRLNTLAQPRYRGYAPSQSLICCWLLRILLTSPPMFRYWNHLAIRCGFGNPSGSNTACSKDPIPISICMCSVRAHQRLIECYVFEIGCGLMMLIETNMHKLSETWQRINGGMFNTMRTPKRP